MSINVPSCLLRHAKKLKIEILISTFSDRQLKNIAKQVTSGSISDGGSATARVARLIANTYNSPYISYGHWRVKYKDISADHPIHEAMIQACSLTKIAQHSPSGWYMDNINEGIKNAEQRNTSGAYIMHWLSKDAKKIMREASTLEVSADHRVRDYIKQLLNREIQSISLELE
jgi:hypothetical protein